MATGHEPNHSDVQIQTTDFSPSTPLQKAFKVFFLEQYKCNISGNLPFSLQELEDRSIDWHKLRVHP